MQALSGPHAMGWEFFGTMLLMLFGNGVCAAVNLRTSAARNTNWLTIAVGWGLAVFIGASVADKSGGHLNPAVTLSLAIDHKLEWSLVPWYFGGQLLGAMAGAILAWAAFKQLFDANNLDDDGNDVKANATTQGIFFTAPVHPNNFWNIVTEFIATYSLLAFILLGPSGGDLGPLKYFAVSFIVIAIGLSVGTPTGYAINPVRDLGPRLMYAFILPIKDKGSAQWAYAWVPVIGPMFAAIAAGLTAVALG